MIILGKKKIYCQNCTNKRRAAFSLPIGGVNIDLCKTCWVGFAYGLKKDLEVYDRNPDEFLRMRERTRQFDNFEDEKE